MAKFKVPVTRTYTKSMEYEVIADNADEALKLVRRERGRKILMEGEFEEESSEFGDPEEIKEIDTERQHSDVFCKMPTQEETSEFINRLFNDAEDDKRQLVKLNQYPPDIQGLIDRRPGLSEYCCGLCLDAGIRPAELTIELLLLDLFDSYLSHEA